MMRGYVDSKRSYCLMKFIRSENLFLNQLSVEQSFISTELVQIMTCQNMEDLKPGLIWKCHLKYYYILKIILIFYQKSTQYVGNGDRSVTNVLKLHKYHQY